MTITAPAEVQAPPVQITRDAAGIDAAVALLSGPDGNLEDVAMLLRRLATADVDAISTVDPAARLQALCAFVAVRLREQFTADIRCAPTAALVALVADASVPCKGPRCSESLLPWMAAVDDYCSAECRIDDAYAAGDDEPFDMSGSTRGVER